jgi:ACS family hexuronate transporter-like MFS transporter
MSGNRWKWWIAIVLFLATVLTYLDRQTLSLCAPMICKEMSLTDEQYGELLAAFRWAYALTHLLAGFFADRFPLRVTYSLAVLVWSAAGAAASFVKQFSQLLWTRRVLGFGEAFNWPCATRIVANLLPPQDRGLASGIFNSGSAAGSLAAPFIILPLAQWLGWRSAFFIIGSLGLVWIALWLFVTRRGTPASAAIRPTPVAPTVRWIVRPGFWMLLLVGVSVNPCWYFLNDWIPKYMHDQRGMSQLTAGMISAPIFLAADLGNLAGGGLVKFLASRGWTLRRARGTTVTLAVLLILPVTLITRVSSATAVVTMLGCAAFGITAILANYTACQADFSFANVGAVAGVLGMACNVFAATVNPWMGRYVDATGTYNLIFTLIGVLPLVALAAILTFDALVWRTHDRDTAGRV